jgi:hypothetical protein
MMDNSDSNAHDVMMSMVRRREGWSIIDNAANLIGHITEKSDEFRTSVINGLWEASERLAKEIGLTSTLTKAFDIGALSTIEQAGRAAERHAEALYISYRFGEEKNASHAFYSDIYSTLAVVCYARLGKYRDNEVDENISKMAAFSYAAMVMTREND